MTDRPHPELLKGQAYRLFLDELSQNIAFAEESLSKGLPKEERADLRIRFHSIKGASGFFGLTGIFKISGRLEDLLKEEEANNGDRNAELRSLVSALSDLNRALPLPG